MSARATEPYPLPLEAQLPPGVAGLAADQSLGQVYAIYRPRMANWFVVILAILVGIAMSWLIVGLVVLWTVAKSPRLSRKQGAKRVYVFDNGFIDAQSADQLTVYRWDQISTVFQFIQNVRVDGIKATTTYLYTVTRLDGATVKLTHFYADIIQLGRTVAMRAAEAQLPHAQAALDQGQNLQFGDITVNAGGISAKGTQMAWNEGAVTLSRGYLVVRRTGERRWVYRTEVRRIPNLAVLMTLAERSTRAAVPNS